MRSRAIVAPIGHVTMPLKPRREPPACCEGSSTSLSPGTGHRALQMLLSLSGSRIGWFIPPGLQRSPQPESAQTFLFRYLTRHIIPRSGARDPQTCSAQHVKTHTPFIDSWKAVVYLAPLLLHLVTQRYFLKSFAFSSTFGGG